MRTLIGPGYILEDLKNNGEYILVAWTVKEDPSGLFSTIGDLVVYKGLTKLEAKPLNSETKANAG